MAATITRYTAAPTWQTSNVSYCKDIMTSLGINTSAIVYETTTEAIYKITNGTGTYADTYLRFYASNQPGLGQPAWKIQCGTGFTANALTGAGAEGGVAYSPVFFTTVVSSDGSYRQLLTFNSSYSYTGGFCIVRPTNTTLTAADAPLTYVASGLAAFNGAAQSLIYTRSESAAQYGQDTSTSYVCITYSTNAAATLAGQYKLNIGKAGTYGVLPNVPILSGGWPIGYNSNLAFVSSAFLPMDRVIVTAGSEEYMVIDQNAGLAIREV